MSATDIAMLSGAALFAVANGVNNGGALAALGASVTGLVPIVAVGMLSVALMVVPLAVGMRVAETLAAGIARWGPTDRLVFLAGVLVAVAIVWGLSRLGLPTSLTLATVGALTGAALGAGIAVSAPTVALVVAAGVLGPTLAGTLAWGVSAAIGRHLARAPVGGALCYGIFAAQASAYAANDGQRMLAVLVVAAPGRHAIGFAPLALVAACFAAGGIIGLWRVGPTLSRRIAAPASGEVLVAQLSALVASFLGYVIGTPLSMTQSTTAGVVGARARLGVRRVRWEEASRLGLAWVLTLPVALAFGALAGWVVMSQGR
ncbi:MAG: inorganic phosphate transporter [Acidimicrobiales bacterium]